MYLINFLGFHFLAARDPLVFSEIKKILRWLGKVSAGRKRKRKRKKEKEKDFYQKHEANAGRK